MNTSPPPAGPLVGADAAEHYVQRRTQDGVAVLTMAGPDGNRFGPDLVAALDHAIKAAWRDDGVRALVLTARGADFCAGPWADLPPPGPDDPEVPPVLEDLATLCANIEAAAKPLVCALHGWVTSGGLALALAAQGRIADARASVQFPEPRLGRLPPGNGAVRLGWRMGATGALRVLNARGPVLATEAAGIVDRVAPSGLLPAAVAYADDLAMAGRVRDVTPGLSDAPGYRTAIAAARAALAVPLLPQNVHLSAIIDAVEAAQLLPPQQALAFDLIHAQDAALTPAARALAHLARATRRALETPEAREAGAGAVRSSPVTAALSPENAARLIPGLLRSGAQATLTAPERDPLAKALESVAEAQSELVQAGKMSQAESERDWQRIAGRLHGDPTQPPALGLADLEHAIWLETTLPEDTGLAIWVPGGRALPDLTRPDKAVALVPAPSRAPRLCEIIVRNSTDVGTDAGVVRQATQLAMRLKLTPIRASGAPVLVRLMHTAGQAAQRLRSLGVTSAQLRATGIVPSGAELGDAAGTIAELPLPVERLVLLAMVNTGAALLREGVSLRPSDLDLAMVLGAGWPNWRGGPMAEADAIGPMVLRHELRLAEGLDPELWAPDALFDRLISDGQRFEHLNAG